MTTKTSTVNPGPPPEKIAEWRLHVTRLARKAAPYAIDLDDMEKWVARIEKQIPNPPPVIDSADVTRKHQEHLRKLCHLRTQMTRIQTRLVQAKAVWGHVLKVIKGYLWIQPEVLALKNDTARSEVLRKIAGKMEWSHIRVSGLIDASEKVIWALKDNQYAAQSMIAVATEERFLYQQGMEK